MIASDGRPPATVFWSSLTDGDVRAAFSVVADDAEVTITAAGILGTAAEGREFFEATLAAFPDLRFTVKKSFTGTDGVTVTELAMEDMLTIDPFRAARMAGAQACVIWKVPRMLMSMIRS